jgi:hypothetical protein
MKCGLRSQVAGVKSRQSGDMEVIIQKNSMPSQQVLQEPIRHCLCDEAKEVRLGVMLQTRGNWRCIHCLSSNSKCDTTGPDRRAIQTG